MRLLILDDHEVCELFPGSDLLHTLRCEMWSSGCAPDSLDFIILKDRYTSGAAHLEFDMKRSSRPLTSIDDMRLYNLIETYRS